MPPHSSYTKKNSAEGVFAHSHADAEEAVGRAIREERAALGAKRLAQEALATAARRAHAAEMLRLSMRAHEAVRALMALGAQAETEAGEANVFCLEWRAMDRALEAIEYTKRLATTTTTEVVAELKSSCDER